MIIKVNPDQKVIENLLVGKNEQRYLINKVKLQKINQLKQSLNLSCLKNIPQVLTQSKYLLNLLKKDRQPQKKIAIQLYLSATYVKMLKTGDYWIEKSDCHLIFNETGLYFLEHKNKSSSYYDGFMCKFNKWLYQGKFLVLKNSIVFAGEDGQIMQKVQNDWIFMKGVWKDGNIIYGRKEIYEGNVSNQSLKSSYQGNFVDNKYDGEGLLYIRNKDQETNEKNKFNTLNGIFQLGKYIGPKSDSQNTKESSGMQRST